jgi:hypothetical protein
MGEKPTGAEDERVKWVVGPEATEDADTVDSSRASNLNQSKSNINRDAGGAGDDPAGIAVSDPGVPGDKPKSK